jgi:hypothetical protein
MFSIDRPARSVPPPSVFDPGTPHHHHVEQADVGGGFPAYAMDDVWAVGLHAEAWSAAAVGYAGRHNPARTVGAPWPAGAR